MAIQTATNPDTGEKVALVDGEWQPILKTATHAETGAKAYLVGNKWLETEALPKAEPKAEPTKEVTAPKVVPRETVSEPTPEELEAAAKPYIGYNKDVRSTKPISVLEGQKLPPVAPTEDQYVVDPKFVRAVQAQLDAMPEEQRTVALAKMVQRPDVYGRAARAVQGRYESLNKIESPTLRNATDTRLEVQKARLMEQGRSEQGAEGEARNAALMGQARPDYQQMTRDIVGEQADEAAKAQAEELKNKGFFGRVGAEAISQAAQTGLGIMQVYADMTGNKQMSNDLMGAQRVENARGAAVPEGQGLFEKSAQHAVASLASQAPAMLLSAVTGSAAPALAFAGIQQFGQAYGEGRQQGLSPELAGVRAGQLAAAEVIFERFGMPKALSGLKSYIKNNPKASIAEYFTKAIGSEIPTEMATTLAQYGIDIEPGVGLNKNPSVKDLFEQLGETLRQTVIQAGGTAAGGVALTKGAQGAVKLLAPSGEERTPYKQDQSYQGLAETLAQNRGFLTPEGQKAPPPPANQTVPIAPGIEAPGEQEPAPIKEEAKGDEARIKELTALYMHSGLPEKEAIESAKQDVAYENAKEGEELATRPVTTPTGVSTGAPIQPTAGVPAEGVKAVEPNGVVPTTENVGLPPSGEGQKPASVEKKPNEDWKNLGQVQRYEEPGVSTATVDKPHGIYTTPADTESPHKDLGGERSTWNVNKDANVLDVTSLAGPDMAMRQSAVGAGAGVAAAKKLLGEELFNKLKGLSKKDLIDAAKGMFPNIDFTKYYDAQEVMEALGAQLAKREGYDAIWQADKDPAWSEFVALTNNAMTPTETKGEQVGTETTEAKQATQEGQEAPAAPAKRGRKAKLTPEEKEAKLAAGKESRAANTAAVTAHKKYSAQLEEAAKPIDPDTEVDKVEAAEQEKKDLRRTALEGLIKAQDRVGNTPAGKRIKELLAKHATPQQIEDVRRGMAEREKRLASYTKENVLTGSLESRGYNASATVGRRHNDSPVNRGFNKATNAAQAIQQILKTGNFFQKLLARKLSGFVNGVSFQVIEKGQPLPEVLQRNMDTWGRASAIYIRDEATGKRSIYVRGESFGRYQGVNNVDVLHELLHAATNQKIYLGLYSSAKGLEPNAAITKFTKELTNIMIRAERHYKQLKAQGALPQDVIDRVESTRDENGDLAIFEQPEEFLAYGMSDENIQDFLMSMEGKQKDETAFSSFVRAIMKLFGIGDGYYNGFSDLVNVTDRLLDSDKTAQMRTIERGEMKAAQLAKEKQEKVSATAVKPEEDEAAKDLTIKTNRAVNTVKKSRAGNELGNAVSGMAATRDPRVLAPLVKALWGSMSYSARAAYSHVLDREGIATQFGDRIPALVEINRSAQHMTGLTQSLLMGVRNVTNDIVRFYRKHPKMREQFEDLVHTSTLAEYDPSNTLAKPRNAVLDRMYNSLPPEGQELYVNLRNHYDRMNKFQAKIIKDQLDLLDLPKGEREKVMKGLREIFEANKRIEPYFPLGRHGDYVLEYGRGPARVSLRFDTKFQRDKALYAYARQQKQSISDLRQTQDLKLTNDIGGVKLRGTIEGTSKLLKTAYEAIDSATLTDPRAKQAMKDEIYQAYLAAMPEASVRKMFIHRKGTPGFSSNILRTLNSSGARMAIQFSRLKYAPEMRRDLEVAQRALQGQEDLTPIVKRMAEFISETIQPQEQRDINKIWDAFAGGLVKLSYLRYLTSWSSAFMQPLDIFLKGAPVLTGNHGPAAAIELSKMAKLWNQYGFVEKEEDAKGNIVVKRNSDGSVNWVAPSIAQAKGLTPDERRAVNQMIPAGVTTNTLANEVFKIAQRTSNVPHGKVTQGAIDLANNLVLGGLMHHGERISREVVFLTSFRLNRKAGRSFDESMDRAVDETNEVFGNYDPDNKPMFMRGATGKLATMYKFFPLITTKLLLGNFFRMIPFMNKEGKKAAATKFFGVLGTHLLFGGVVALPMFSLVMDMLGAAWKQWGQDPDAPDDMKSLDYETWFRTEFLPSVFGNTGLANLAEYGALNRLTGLDFSSRLSLNDMWFRDPTPGHTVKESIANLGLLLGGPAANLGLSFMQGLEAFSNGDYEQGMEKILPGSISNLIASHRIGKEGYQDYQGAQLVQPGKVPTSELIGKGMGYSPAAIASAQTKAFKAQAVDKQVLSERAFIEKQLKDNYRKMTDPALSPEKQERFFDRFQDAVEKVMAFSEKHPEYEFKDDEVEQALGLSAEKRATAELFGGVNITEKNARINLPTAEHNVKTLEKAYGK